MAKMELSDQSRFELNLLKALFIFLSPLFLLLLVLWFWDQSYIFRLRATATVLVDGVEYTGSSVQEFKITWTYEPQIGRNGAWGLKARGEAVRIDIPDEEPIYVPISADPVFYNCIDLTSQDSIKTSLSNIIHCDLPKFPPAVRFDGRGGAERIHADIYGSGRYEFVSMSFTRTIEPVTEGRIPERLYPYQEGRPLRVPYTTEKGSFIAVITRRDFKQEKFF